MKTSIALAFIFATLVFIAETDARPGRSKSSLSTDEDLGMESDVADTHRHSGSGRRVRHSRQIYPGYYSQPYSESFESRVLLSLEEIILKLKLISEQLPSRSLQFPYPVYIPYPYPVQFNTGNDSFPTIGTRFSGPVWGMVNTDTKTPSDDEDDEGSRPISLKPSKQNLPQGVRTPPVEHGSVQAEKSQTTEKPVTTTKQPKTKARVPTICEAAILNCCRFGEPERKNCFEQLKCSKSYATGKACLPEVIDMVIKIFTSAYMPR